MLWRKLTPCYYNLYLIPCHLYCAQVLHYLIYFCKTSPFSSQHFHIFTDTIPFIHFMDHPHSNAHSNVHSVNLVLELGSTSFDGHSGQERWYVRSLLHLSCSLQGSSSICLHASCFGTSGMELWHQQWQYTTESIDYFCPRLFSRPSSVNQPSDLCWVCIPNDWRPQHSSL